MNPWVRFFLGTPQRFLATLAAVLVLASVVNPSIPAAMAQGVVELLRPFIGIAATIAIVVIGFKMIMGGFRGRK